MVSGTLYTYPGNYRSQKIQIAAAYSGADVKVASDFEFGVTNVSDAFLAKFPMGKVSLSIITPFLSRTSNFRPS